MRLWPGCGAMLAAALVLAGAGCGGGQKPVKVAGLVKLDGKPLGGATVSFVPEGGNGRPAGGRTDADGAFQLSTYGTADGAMPGDYKVTVKVDVDLGDPKLEGGEMKQEDKYRRFAEMDRRTKSSKSPVPAVYADASKTPLRQRVPPDGPVALELSSKTR